MSRLMNIRVTVMTVHCGTKQNSDLTSEKRTKKIQWQTSVCKDQTKTLYEKGSAYLSNQGLGRWRVLIQG